MRVLWIASVLALVAIPFARVGASAVDDALVRPLPRLPDVAASETYQVFVNGREVPVSIEQPAHGHPVESAAFEFEGGVEVRVVVDRKFKDFRIRPLRHELAKSAARDGAELRFKLDSPRHLVLEFDNLPHLALINSAIGDEPPSADDPDVLYFGPGVHEPGRILVRSNQTIVLAAGAKVYGTIEGTCVENVRVTGRGYLYGTKHTDWNRRTYGIVFDRSRNITIENIGIRDCYWWTTNFVLCDDVKIRDINLITFNRNNGGLMIDGCSNLDARDCLLMSRDDCICPHALNAAGNGEELSENMLFENMVLYNCHDGNGIRIGASFETSEVRNWVFRGIDVVRRAGAAIIADHSDWATVRNLVFEDFYDEIDKTKSIDMFVAETRYSCQTGYRDDRGRFDGVFFINYRSAGGKIVLRGFDPEHSFRNVVFADCWIGDRRVLNKADLEANQFVYDLRFLPSSKGVTIPKIDDAGPSETAEDESRSPATLVIDDGDDSGFRSFGFSPQSEPDDSHGSGAHIGKVIDKFGQYAAAIYEPKIAGRYEIYAYWGSHKGVDTRAPWIVKHRDGYARVYLNQDQNPGWHLIGTFDLDPASNVRLVYPNYFEPTEKPVVADAVKFVRVSTTE